MLPPVADGGIDRTIGKVGILMRRLDPQGELRMAPPEIGERRHQNHTGEKWRRADPEFIIVLAALEHQLAAGVIQDLERRRDRFEVVLTVPSQLHRARAALKQFYAEQRFETSNLVADG